MSGEERKWNVLSRMSEQAQANKSPGYECFILYGDDYHDVLSRCYPQPRGQLHAGGQATTEEFVREHEERLKQGVRVLDVCCGEGYTVSALAERFPQSRFVGLDIVQKAITTAMSSVQSKGNLAFVQGTVFDLPFEDESFDIVLGQDPDGFCHRDRLVALQETFRVLRLGGTFYMHLAWIPSGWTAKQMDDYERIKRDVGAPTASGTAQAFVEDVENAGFVVDDASDLTSLAKEHFNAYALSMRRVEGEVSPWISKMVQAANAGRRFGLKLIAHRENLFELVHLEKYDAIKDVLRSKSAEEILSYRDWAKFTVLHHAAKDGKLSMVKWLIEKKKIPVDVEDGNGSTPAYRAIGFGRDEVRLYLMKMGADLSHINAHGSSALHNTCDTGDEELSFYLVEKGICDPFLPSNRGNTPVSEAIGKLHDWVTWIFDSKVTEVKRFVRWRLRRYDLAFLDYGEDDDGIESVVSKIVKRHVTDLLRHPLVYHYFALRWDAFGRRSSLIDTGFHFLDLGVYVAFIVSLQYQGRSSLYELIVIGLALLLIGVSYKNLRSEYCQFKDATASYRTVYGRTVLLNDYWVDMWNYVELTLYVVVSAIALLVLCAVAADGRGGARFSDSDGVAEVLMITTLLFFFRTLRFLSLFKFIGPYIQTIFRMTRDMGIFFSFFLVFWIAFGMAFFVKFSEAEVGSFWSILRNVLEQFILGDGDRIRDAIDDAGPVAQLVYVLMLLFMPLLLINLVIAMLVNTYDSVQYQATEEYLIIWAGYILEKQASVPLERRKKLLREASIRSFHAIPAENNTAIDTDALARGFEFSHDCTWVWTKDLDQVEEEETQAMQYFRDHFLHDMRHLELGIAGAVMKRKAARQLQGPGSARQAQARGLLVPRAEARPHQSPASRASM